MSTLDSEQLPPTSKLHPAGSGAVSAALSGPVVAVVAVWACSALLAVFAPDMVTGSEHDHLPIAAMTVWPWTVVATAYVLMAGRRTGAGWLVWCVAALWVCVFAAGVAAPVMVTGSDPTEIPIGALLAPVGGALATGLLALHHATHTGPD
jgi:hypothetical protein